MPEIKTNQSGLTGLPERHSHADLSIARRRLKGEKIARLLEVERSLVGQRILEIGAGSGVISALLGERVGETGKVAAVDILDERVVTHGYDFTLVAGVRLPFPDQSFDIVVTNHVLEHVGGEAQQCLHLREIARVLRRDGIGYLAVPNRWTPVEPHYRLWFLSWLPRPLSHAYVRLAGRGRSYDCDPPGPLRVRRLLDSAGLSHRDVTADAIRLMGEIEGRATPTAVARFIPRAFLSATGPFLPTSIRLLTKATGGPSSMQSANADDGVLVPTGLHENHPHRHPQADHDHERRCSSVDAA